MGKEKDREEASAIMGIWYFVLWFFIDKWVNEQVNGKKSPLSIEIVRFR